MCYTNLLLTYLLTVGRAADKTTFDGYDYSDSDSLTVTVTVTVTAWPVDTILDSDQLYNASGRVV